MSLLVVNFLFYILAVLLASQIATVYTQVFATRGNISF